MSLLGPMGPEEVLAKVAGTGSLELESGAVGVAAAGVNAHSTQRAACTVPLAPNLGASLGIVRALQLLSHSRNERMAGSRLHKAGKTPEPA